MRGLGFFFDTLALSWQVNLSSNILTFVPPDAFESLSRLTSLDLNSNMLASLPEQLGLLTDLTRLNLRRNQLKELPKDVRKCIRLIHMDVTDNMLIEIPPLWGQLVGFQTLNPDPCIDGLDCCSPRLHLQTIGLSCFGHLPSPIFATNAAHPKPGCTGKSQGAQVQEKPHCIRRR